MAPPLPFSKLLFRPRSAPFLPAPQIPRILTSGVHRSGSGGLRRMCASESTSARATRPVPAVNGDVVARAGAGAGAGGKFRFADVSLGGFLGVWGLLALLACWLVGLLACLWGFWVGGEAMAFFRVVCLFKQKSPTLPPALQPPSPNVLFPPASPSTAPPLLPPFLFLSPPPPESSL